MTLRKNVHLGIHTASHEKFVFSGTTAKKSAFSDVAAFSIAQKNGYPGIHTATTSPCLVTRPNRQRSVTLQRLVALRKDVHAVIHTATTSSVFGDTAKDAAFSDAAVFY